jgi:hypothetical protein
MDFAINRIFSALKDIVGPLHSKHRRLLAFPNNANREILPVCRLANDAGHAFGAFRAETGNDHPKTNADYRNTARLAALAASYWHTSASIPCEMTRVQ